MFALKRIVITESIYTVIFNWSETCTDDARDA